MATGEGPSAVYEAAAHVAGLDDEEVHSAATVGRASVMAGAAFRFELGDQIGTVEESAATTAQHFNPEAAPLLPQCPLATGVLGAPTWRRNGTSNVATTKASMMARNASAKASVEASR